MKRGVAKIDKVFTDSDVETDEANTNSNYGKVMIRKYANAVIVPEVIEDTDELLSNADLELNDKMKKFAQELKTIAPQASDFLYFTAVMMHAAEASLIDDDGDIKKDASGNPVTAHWEQLPTGSVRWVCSDPSIRPYKNSNNDIFPASELKKAYPKWVGRPLCLDHKSSSVEHVRGVIVDTHWDEKRQRIVALCALDKVNYADLARKVASGYATNVSMGTAVGRAVCTEEGCHRVAKVESDFCDHMRKRSCYGEINLDLSPIELSLVVTGADPKAKVKHIIAKDLSAARKAAEALESYLDKTIKLASAEDAEVQLIKDELAKLNERVASLQTSLDEAEASDGDENNATGPTHSSDEMKEGIVENQQPAFGAGEDFASFAKELASINSKLDKISSLHNSEGSMTKKNAYWQGTEEPTPGKPQYPVEPGEEARMQDKHMVGQSPFPDVGPVDGMHPGYESHEGSEEERKRKLQRLAEQQRREEIRKAALAEAKKQLESVAYPQGTEEPTPAGKPQYTPDPLEMSARQDDKQMVGAPPFPEVGAVDGLYGDDLKTKEMLSRAKLKATFKKASDDGALNKAGSRWEVSAGKTLILTASVDEISRGNADVMYDMVATADFGRSMIKTIQAEGYETARAKFKGAQAAPPAGGAPGAPAGEPAGAGPAPELGGEGLDEGPGEDELEEALREAKTILEEALDEVEPGADALDKEDLGGAPPAPTDEAAFKGASVESMRKTVNAMLGESFKETIATLRAHKDELETAETVLKSKYASFDGKHKLYFASLVDKAVADAKKTASDCGELKGAFVRYAAGTAQLEKKAQIFEGVEGDVHVPGFDGKGKIETEVPEVPFPDMSQFGEGMDTNTDEMTESDSGMFVKDKDENKKKEEDEKKPDKEDKKDDKKPDKEDKKDDKKDDDKSHAADALFADVTVSTEDLDKLPQDTTLKLEASAPDLTTKEGRAMYRAKLAQQGMQFSDMLGKAHSGGVEPGNMDVKPTGDLAKVETIDEVSKAMNDLANMPPKVRKQAQEIAQLVQEGKLAADEVDGLAAYAVDKDAIAYYKAYWGEAKDSESNEFAAKLVEEQKKAKAAAELETETVKIKRAHELAYEMRDRGMIDTSQINQQVKEILSWNDEGFTSVKNIVAKQEPLAKTASVPQVGLLHSGDVYLPSAVSSAAEASGSTELTAALAAHFANKRL